LDLGDVTPEELAPLRPRLEVFAARMLDGALSRQDQHVKGELYVRGLMLDGRRKSVQPMAERLGVDHQGLQQFLSGSTWDWESARRNVGRWAMEVIIPQAIIIDDVGFPKDGGDSPGVARMYCGALGKTGNCQIGVSVHLATDHASSAVNWRLFLPESWDPSRIEDDGEAEEVHRRRERCKIPDDAGHREKWRLALDMLDQQRQEWEIDDVDLPVLADAAYGDNTQFRLGLEERQRHYVLAVSDGLSAYAGEVAPELREYSGKGRPPLPRYGGKPANLKKLAMAAGRKSLHQVTWRQGTKKTTGNPTAKMRSRFMALLVRPANRHIPRDVDGTLPERLLLVEWPTGEKEPTDYWITDLPADTPLRVLVLLAKLRWRIEHDYRELNSGLGLKHFEGRSFAGWHRHITLAVIAQAFCNELRLDPKAPAPA
jgi:SRSO17 transposase